MTQTSDIIQAIRDRRLKIGSLESQIVTLEGEIEKLTSAAKVMGVDVDANGIEHLNLDIDEAPKPGDMVEAAKRYGYVKDAIKQILGRMVPGIPFNVNHVAAQMLEIIPSFNLETNKTNISAYLKEFSDAGEIEIIQPGRGRTPATYSVKK